MSDNKKPGVTFWVTVVVILALVGYPLMWGPVCWAKSRWRQLPIWTATDFVYRPVAARWFHPQDTIASRVICWYANLAAAEPVYPCTTRGTFYAGVVR
jgi:hypothetical protein